MSTRLPSVTIIVPARPDQETIPAVEGAKKLDYPSGRLEIIVARGRQPACQRNAALRRARGRLVYFLDDDAMVRPGNLKRALQAFEAADVQVVGGPNVCPRSAPFLEQIIAVVLGSWLAFGPSRARYEPLGTVRETTEKELILCNLVARRESLLEAGGFDEALYPNEENALMDLLQRKGGRLVYDPELVVERRPRSTLRAFARMLFSYGRGRAEQFRRTPTLGSLPNFVPPGFVLYLLATPWWGGVAWVPLGCYGLALAAQAAVSSLRHGFGRALLAVPLVVMTHLLYGLGFWRGLFTRLSNASLDHKVEVALEVLKPLPHGE